VRKVKGTLHWVSEAGAVEAEVRQFDRLYRVERPGKASGNHLDDINPSSLIVLRGCKVERCLLEVQADEPAWSDGLRRFQFERLGYFCVDASEAGGLVFNRTVTLKDSWAKESQKD
jgi:glutaminyl-tRNA synthetase